MIIAGINIQLPTAKRFFPIIRRKVCVEIKTQLKEIFIEM